MSYLYYLEYAAWVWLAFAVPGAVLLYMGFCFAMAAKIAPFLDAKDPKGWHLREPKL